MARVTLYYPWIYLKSGIERTLIEYKKRSRHDITLMTSRFEPEGTFPELREMDVRIIGKVSVKRTYVEVIRSALNIFRIRFDPADHDLLMIACDGLGPLAALGNRKRPILNLCFTPLRAVYDAEYRARLMDAPLHKRTLRRAIEAVFRPLDRLAWSRLDSVICDSRTAADRVVEGGLFPKDKVLVSYPGIDADIIAPSEVFEPYFFLPGRIMWTKNIELAIDAFRLTHAQAPGFRLIVAGMVDRKSQPYFDGLRARAADLPQIEFMTDVSDEVMDRLYRNCTCVLQSAFNEDLGLTPFEGMARGKPCIAVNRGGPRETIANGETGFLQEPTPDSYAQAMIRIATDPELARTMGRAGAKRVERFTWQVFVEEMDSDVDRLIAAAETS